ncbi:hypothetical protein KSF_051430 [Reticulibacter mediterranei]|uniref:Uncharacterized protein n=1 Tax=Reticulibacter mediterranei TaxID=2778369 RepID=A0A8J3N495_9CHLR|nr:hypothetical protein [Reticulibacter mediterranei]GHO95095.1 hypothetical protein KSF_051430 [Reticulibacter mediterranei]
MLSSQERTSRLQQAAEQFAAQARTLGAGLDEALQALRQIWNLEEQVEERS